MMAEEYTFFGTSATLNFPKFQGPRFEGIHKTAGVYDRNPMVRMHRQEVFVAGYNVIRISGPGTFQNDVVFRIATVCDTQCRVDSKWGRQNGDVD